MSFGHINILAAFMDLMNRIIQPNLDQCVVMFINDIVIYSKSKEDHVKHLRIVLHLLREKQLYAKFKKCEFWLEQVGLLRHIITKQGISVAPAKIEAINNWARLTNGTKIGWILLKICGKIFQNSSTPNPVN